MTDKSIRFDYRAGILEGASPATGREWCWFKGDLEIVISDEGQIVGVLEVRQGATVAEVKAAIRGDAKGKK